MRLRNISNAAVSVYKPEGEGVVVDPGQELEIQGDPVEVDQNADYWLVESSDGELRAWPKFCWEPIVDKPAEPAPIVKDEV